tara:strand:+ start:1044 stop:1169 length:126 start_codon:yes stop_codon:yes gene_type:complete
MASCCSRQSGVGVVRTVALDNILLGVAVGVVLGAALGTASK